MTRRYELIDEDARLWNPGEGDLVRLRTWDIFTRFLPARGRIADIGGGPGTHSAHLALRGYDVGFWAYFHRPDELVSELDEAGFTDIQLLSVEDSAGYWTTCCGG